MRLREHERHFRLSFDNGISVEVLRRGSVYGGLGQVRLRRRKLRCADLPIMPLITTPDGHEVSRLDLQHVERGPDSVTLTLTPYVKHTGRTEWHCYDGQDRLSVAPWEREPERDRGGSLRVALQAVSRTIGGVPFAGFSYSYKFRSRRHRVYRIHDRATWDLGGSATGNAFWMRGPYSEPQKTFRNRNDAYTTAWHGDDGDAVLQQFLPLFTVLQGFTFQFDRQNLLVTAFEEPFHCRSMFQKNRGENYLTHWHQLCCDLSACAEFPPLQVLCADVPGDDPAAMADIFCAVRDDLQRDYAEHFGVSREGAVVSGRLATGDGASVEATERGLDELGHAGCARVYAPSILAPDASPPRSRKRSARPVAPLERIRRIVDHAHQRGMEVAVSLEELCSPELLVAVAELDGGPDGGPADAGAELLTRAALDKRANRRLLDHLRRIKRASGVDALFSQTPPDGVANQFQWESPNGQNGTASRRSPGRRGPRRRAGAGTIRSLQEAHVELLASVQRLGYGGPLASVASLAGPMRGVTYESLSGREFMFRDCLVEFPNDSVLAAKADPLETYFRGCAHRVMYLAVFDTGRGAAGRMAPWWKEGLAAANKAYHAVREHMERSRVLPDGAGVLWSGPDPDVRVLWCLKPFAWAAGEEAEVFDVMAAKPVEAPEGRFGAEPLTVYLVQNALAP